MAGRPEFPACDDARAAKSALKRSLSMLSPHSVLGNYQKLLEQCRLREETPPSPRVTQELVTLWKVLWIWRK
jgi:hypothetical protein